MCLNVISKTILTVKHSNTSNLKSHVGRYHKKDYKKFYEKKHLPSTAKMQKKTYNILASVTKYIRGNRRQFELI